MLDWTQVGAAIAAIVAAIGGASAWWQSKKETGLLEPDQEHQKKSDTDELFGVVELKGIIQSLKDENTRQAAVITELGKRELALWERIRTLQDELYELRVRMNDLDGKNGKLRGVHSSSTSYSGDKPGS